MKKLYLLDGMSIAFRAYHALGENKLTNSEGLPTAAIFGFVNIITSFLERANPEYIAVAFDCREPTFRHRMYPEYKANRKAFPEDLGVQLPYIKSFLGMVGITCIEKPGFEADDVIGTLSRQASQDGTQVFCLTADKDFFQLLDDNVFLIKSKHKSNDFDLIGINDVKEKFGVEASQVIDYLALIGDASDNIPGVKGIGEKTAIPLIEQFNDIETIYENIAQIEKPRTKKLLLENKDLCFLSKELVTIDRNVALDIDYNSLVRGEIVIGELDEMFKNLGFKGMREKWRKLSNLANKQIPEGDLNEEVIEQKTTAERLSTTDYILVDMKNINTMLADIGNAPRLAICVETDIADRNSSEIVGISFCNSTDKAYYLPLSTLKKDANEENLFDEGASDLIAEYVIVDLQGILEDTSIMKIGHNIKQTAFALKKHNINLSPIAFDTAIAGYLLDTNNDSTIKFLTEKYLSYSPISLSNFSSDKKYKKDGTWELSELTVEQRRDYFCDLTNSVFKLYIAMTKKLNSDNLFYVAESIEFPLIEVLTNMEFTGISIDSKLLGDIGNDISKKIEQLKKFIFSETSIEFNLDSPKQTADVLYNKMGLHTGKKNKSGYSTDLQTLTELAQLHPVADLILNYRKYTKIKNTYIDALPKLVNVNTQRIHTTFNQAVANTGRLSSVDPNLQNIPIRTDIGKEIRATFIARSDDFMLLSADYSQIELRIMAFLSKDENLISAFNNNIDVHTATASLLFNVDTNDVTADMRRTAKTVNFGIMYGLGTFGLSQRLQITKVAADAIIKSYFEKFAGIKKYMTNTLDKVRHLGYAETMTGRKRYFPDINNSNFNIRSAAERAAINMPIQGSASDMIKIAMINIYQLLKQQGLRTKMLLQVHDELLFETVVDEMDLVADLINTQMIYSLPLDDVPLAVSIGVGKNWIEAHS